MNTFAKTLLLTLSILLLSSASAMASTYTVDFTDNAITFPGWEFTAETGDVIGTPNITGGTATFERTGGSTYLTSVTFNILVNQHYQAYNQLSTGDLFIDLDYDASLGGYNTWDYVAHNSSHGDKLYEFNRQYNYYNHNWNDWAYEDASYPGNANIRDYHPVEAERDARGAVVDGSILFEDLPDATHNGQTLSLTISGMCIEVGDLVTLGYTVSCANDVIFTTLDTTATPIPGAAWLLGTGLLGLIGLRRRMNG